MVSRDKVDVDVFHKSIQYALEKLGKSKSGFERKLVSKFKRKRRVGSGNELVDYSRAPCLGADQKARGLWERDCKLHLYKPIIWSMAAILCDSTVVVVRTRPRAIPLLMVTMRKSVHVFLFPYMVMGLRLADLGTAGAPLKSLRKN